MRNRTGERRRTRALGWTGAREDRFVEVLAETGRVADAAAAAGLTEAQAYYLRHRDAGFAARWADAIAICFERLEAMLVEQALKVLAACKGGKAALADLQFALAVLKLRDAEGDRPRRRAANDQERKPTPDEIADRIEARMALLNRKLDGKA